MCGIAGFIVRSDATKSIGALRPMTRALAHRGPDGEGFFEAPLSGDRYLGLGHRRLSIIDLEHGRQPMASASGRLQLVFNGEIYNFQSLRAALEQRGHHFTTRSDTEVILHAYEAYGESCVEHLRGMFAFALWDSREQKLFLARDRFGKKPLFLHERGGALAFSSEIKSLLAFPGLDVEIDLDALWDYFAYRYVPAPATLFRGVRKLLPGHVAVWKDGVLRERSYYEPPDGAAPGGDDGVRARERFAERLEDAVAIRMVSDVPFGAFLSGGIDSSAIVALMSRHSDLPVRTYAVGFTKKAYSELEYARTVATKFRTDHHELIVSQEELMKELPGLIRFRDAPVAEPSDIPLHLLAKEARRSVKMVLTGEGADEILAGYPKHVVERYAAAYQRLPSLLRHGLVEPLVNALPYRFRRMKVAVESLGLEAARDRFPRWFGCLSPRDRAALLTFHPPQGALRELPRRAAETASSLRRILYFDQTSWLPDNILERGDRMSMAASLEARMPFMDQDLAGFVSALPDRFRVRGGRTKWILREAMRDVLPPEIVKRPKVGFHIPVSEWFRGPMRDYLYDHLASPSSVTRAYYRSEVLDKVLSEHVRGRQNHEKLLWTLLTLEIWKREYLGAV